MNQGGGYGNRMSNPLYLGWLAADNTGTDISGATNLGLIANVRPSLYLLLFIYLN